MLGLTSSAKWWEDWQLRTLVLGSLCIQFFLLLAGFIRQNMPGLLRKLLWLAYLSGDTLAIYALATLFTRQKLPKPDEGAVSALEVIWAPVLLIHLGGQFTISAYSLQDNELWRRHVFTVVTRVTIALYVFCKWWSGDKRLLQAAIMLFVVGVIRFAEKPWALRKASFDNLKEVSGSMTPIGNGRIGAFWRLCTSTSWEHRTTISGSALIAWDFELKHYVEQASQLAPDTAIAGFQDRQNIYRVLGVIGNMDYFVDVVTPYTVRLRELLFFRDLDDKVAYSIIKLYISSKFSNMYTTERAWSSPLGSLLHLLVLPSLAVASVVLFAWSPKDYRYNDNDIIVTYILFFCTAGMEFIPLANSLFKIYRKKWNPRSRRETIDRLSWNGMLVQHNLLSYYTRKKKPTFLMKIVCLEFLAEVVNMHQYTKEVESAFEIVVLVRAHVKKGWNEYIRGDTAKYKRFNNFRGQLALERLEGGPPPMAWSLNLPFDQSVLVWHVATDLCFHRFATTLQCQGRSTTKHSRQISNYMVYLLYFCPEMLMPGTRRGLFSMAIRDIDFLLKNSRPIMSSEENYARAIVEWIPIGPDLVVGKARHLALQLACLEEDKRWEVIQGVWVEMLCYSASRCRGYLHAKSLGEGQEFLSMVWLAWLFMGMQTWADRHQNMYPEQEAGVGEERGPEVGAGARGLEAGGGGVVVVVEEEEAGAGAGAGGVVVEAGEIGPQVAGDEELAGDGGNPETEPQGEQVE